MFALFALLTCDVFTPGLGETVDLEAPTITITSHNNGDYVAGTVNLSGNVTDDKIISSVSVNRNSITENATVTEENWTFSFDTSSLIDGEHEFTVTTTDESGKSSSTTIFLVVDNGPPTVVVTTPAAYGSDQEFNNIVTIKGEAADTTRLHKVYVSLYETASEVAVFTDEEATGTANWFYQFDAGSSGYNLEDEYNIVVTAEDNSGNKNSYMYHMEDILALSIDQGDPPLTQEIHAADFENGDLSTKISGDLSTIRLDGTTNPLMSITINPNSDQPAISFNSPQLPNTTVNDDWSDNIFASTQSFNGLVEDDDAAGINPDSVKYIVILENEGTTTEDIIDPSDNSDSGDWNSTTDALSIDDTLWTVVNSISGNTWRAQTSLDPGNYYLFVKAQDAANDIQGISSEARFTVSASAPSLTINSPAQGIYIGSGGSTTFSVTVNGEAGDGVSLDVDADGDYTNAITLTTSDDITFTGTVTAGTDFILLNDAQEFKIRAGKDGAYAEQVFQFTGDTESPTVAIDYPVEAQEVNDTLELIGKTSDNNLTSEVYLYINDSATLPTEPPSPADASDWETYGWIVPSGTFNWSYTLDTTTRTDNTTSYLFVKAIDAAGNGSNLSLPEASLSFTVNQESERPVFTLSNMIEAGSPNGLGQDASIIGSVEDDDKVDASTLEVLIDIYNDGLTENGLDLDGSGTPGDAANESEDWIPVSSITADTADVKILGWTHDLTNVPQGEHSFQMRVRDINSDGTETVEADSYYFALLDQTTFQIDYGPPTLLITAPDNGVIKNSTFSITGTASDPNGVTDVDISFDNGSTWDSLFNDPSGQTTVNWSHTFTVETDGTTDAKYNYQVRATDASGGTTTKERQFEVDATIPTVSIDYPVEGQSINGTINFAGKTTDNNITSAVYLYINTVNTPPAEPASPTDAANWTSAGWRVPAGTFNWSDSLDTSTLTDGQTYYLFVKALDSAENGSDMTLAEGSISFIVDQESDRPVFTLSNMTEAGAYNGLGQDASIIGSLEDDDKIDASTLEVLIDIYNDGSFTGIDLDGSTTIGDADNETETWIPVSSITVDTADVKILGWTHELLNIPQGEHSFQMRVRDIYSDGTETVEADSYHFALLDQTTFLIDYGPPDLVIDSPANGVIENSTFSITGTASDPNGVTDVDITFDGGTSWTSLFYDADGQTSVNWSHTVTVAANGTTDGKYTYQVQATDKSGGKSTKDRQFDIDATLPTLAMDYPLEGDSLNGNGLELRGSSNDNHSVDSIYIHIHELGDTPPADHTTWETVTNIYSWSYILDTLPLVSDEVAVDYEIALVAFDTAGNESLEFDRVVSIDQTSDRPVITFNDLDKTAVSASSNVLVGSSYITGIVEDDDGIDPTLFSGVVIEINIDGGGWTAVSDPPSSSGKLVSWRHNISSLTEGEHSVSVRVKDKLSDGTTGASSADALYTSNFNWGIEDSADQSGVPFILNTGAPSIAIDTPISGSYYNSDVTISGTAEDGTNIGSIEIKYGTGLWEPLVTSPGTNSVNWSTTKTVSADGSDDNTYTFQIRATDIYGSAGIANGNFTADATQPVVTINQPSAGNTLNGNIVISGTAGDLLSLDKVYYNISLSTNPTPLFPDDYTLFTGSYSWNKTIDTTDNSAGDDIEADGTYTLRVVSVDSATNNSISAGVADSVEFTVDQESDRPDIDITTFTDTNTFGGNLVNINKQLSGNVSDDDGVDASTMQYKLYDESSVMLTNWANISNQPSSDSTLANWSHTFTEADGKYHVQLRAADINAGEAFTAGAFNWVETGLYKITIDSTAPVISLDAAPTTPDDGDGICDAYLISSEASATRPRGVVSSIR